MTYNEYLNTNFNIVISLPSQKKKRKKLLFGFRLLFIAVLRFLYVIVYLLAQFVGV